MADNTLQTGADTIATDEVATLNGVASSGVKVQRVKNAFGDDGVSRDVSTLFPMPAVTPSASVVGSITAANANPSTGTATANSTVQFTIPDGHTSWTMTFAGTFSAGTLIAFQCSLDGVTWFYTNGRLNQSVLGVNETVSQTSTDVVGGAAPAGGNPSLWKGTTGGVRFLRASAQTLTASDNVTVRIESSAGVGGTFLLGSIPPGTSQLGTIGEMRAATLGVTATAATATAATLSLPAPGANLFHYITALTIDLYSTAARTGVATPIVVNSTNLPGNPAWTFSTAGAIGAIDRYTVPLVTPLRSSAANTASSITGPGVTGAIWRLNASYFTAP